ncbi:MAG: cytochrome c biogenesis protein ResB, partial [Mariniphaga sp.]
MKRILDFLFSMQLAGVILLILATSLAAATFIENDYGTLAAQQLVFRATWFEVLMIIFCINLLGAIFQKRLLQRKKYGAFLFHAAMVVILIGAGITRFISYEGTMMIREGKTSSVIYSENPYIQVRFTEDGKEHNVYKKKVFSPFSNNSFNKDFQYNSSSFRLEVEEFVPNAARTVTETAGGKPYISMVLSDGGDRQNILLGPGEVTHTGNISLYFSEAEMQPQAINFFLEDGELKLYSNYKALRMSMASQQRDTLTAGTAHSFLPMHLYSFGDVSVVLQEFYPSAEVRLVSRGSAGNTDGQNAIVVSLTHRG